MRRSEFATDAHDGWMFTTYARGSSDGPGMFYQVIERRQAAVMTSVV
jgi:hypothetical protein